MNPVGLTRTLLGLSPALCLVGMVYMNKKENNKQKVIIINKDP
jgi:hypothetical protein